MEHSLKEWVAVTRYWSFPVSVMPVVATFAFLCSTHQLPSGCMPVLCFVLSVLGIVIGLVITLLSGPKLLVVGGVGVLLTILYSILKYNALGDLDIFVIFGILPVLGTSYAVTGHFCPDALVLSLPLGIITVSVLHANNTFDIESDRAAGIKTFAMLLGGEISSRLYMAYMVIPFVCVAVSVIFGWISPFSLLCLVAVIPAWNNLKAASHYQEKALGTMAGLDQASAKLQLVFSGLLSLGLFVSALF